MHANFLLQEKKITSLPVRGIPDNTMNGNTPHDDFGTISIAGEQAPPEPAIKKSAPKPGGPEKRRRPRRLGRLKTALGILSALAVLFLLSGYFLIPYLTTTLLADHLGKVLNRPVTIAEAEFDPFSLTLTLHKGIVGPRLDNPQDTIDPLLSFDRFMIDLEAGGLWRGRLVCRKSEFDRPFLHLVRESQDSYNLTSLTDQGAPGLPAGLLYSLNNIKINGGAAIFTDRPTGKSHRIENIQLAIPALSNFAYQAEQYIQPEFSATINGSPLELSGETTVRGEGLEAKLSLQLKDLDLPQYIAYLPMAIPLQVTRGKISLDCGLIFSSSPDSSTKFQLEGSGQLTDLHLQDREGNVNKFSAVKFTGRIAPLLREFVFQEIAITQPDLHFDKNSKGKWNVETLFPDQGADSPGNPREKGKIVLDSVSVANGRLTIIDRFVPRGYTSSWSGLQFSLKGFNSRSDQAAEFALTAQGNGKTGISAQGKIVPSRDLLDGLLVLNEADLVSLNPYLSHQAENLAIKSGTATKLGAQIMVQEGKDQLDVRLKELEVALKDLALEMDGRTVFNFPSLACKEAELNLAGRSINLGKIQGRKASFHLPDSENGRGPAAGSTPDKHGAKDSPRKQWEATLKEAHFSESTLTLQSRLTAPPLPIKLDNLEFAFTTGKDGAQEGRLQGKAVLNGSGRLEFAGPLRLKPFGTKLEITLEQQVLESFEPLFSPWFTPEINKGLFSARGTVSLPDFSYSGAARVDTFSGALEGREIIAFQRATAGNLELRTGPVRVASPAIEVTAPLLAWYFGPDGTNLARVFKNPLQKGLLPEVEIGAISLDDGRLILGEPGDGAPVTTEISRLSGAISSLKSRAGNRAGFTLNGRINGEAPIDCSGRLGFFDEHLAATVDFRLAELNITALAPYLDEILGYRSRKGTLAGSGSLHLESEAIDLNSLVILKDFELGGSLGGHALLPLTLALLTDGQSRLELRIPLQGSFTDETFSITRGLTRFVRGLMVKTAVAPFSLLSQPGGEKPPASQLFFPPGETGLTPDQTESLKALKNLLADRPGLRLVITGFADDRNDRQALFEIFAKEEAERIRREEARLSAEMSAQYGNEEIVTPGEAPVQEMVLPQPKKIEVREADLVELARKRRETVYDFLRNQLQMPAESLEKGATRILAADGPPGIGQSRVDFDLVLKTRTED